MAAAPAWKAWLGWAARLGLVAALLGFLWSRGFLSLEKTALVLEHPVETGVGILLMMVCQLLGAYRWNVLLGAQSLSISLMKAVQLSFIGSFFNLALPGAVSGDVVKAYYVGKVFSGQQPRAFGAILFDRVMGLAALLVVSSVGFMWPGAPSPDNPVFTALKVSIEVLAACCLAFYAYLLLLHPNKDPVRRVVLAVEARIPKVRILREMYDGMRDYHGAPKQVVWAFCVSLSIHALIGVAFLQFAHAVGDDAVTLLKVYVAAPAGIIATTIPVAPAGLGTGHAAFLALFKLVGSERGADIYTVFALVQVAFSLLGGLAYLGFKSGEGGPKT